MYLINIGTYDPGEYLQFQLDDQIIYTKSFPTTECIYYIRSFSCIQIGFNWNLYPDRSSIPEYLDYYDPIH